MHYQDMDWRTVSLKSSQMGCQELEEQRPPHQKSIPGQNHNKKVLGEMSAPRTREL